MKISLRILTTIAFCMAFLHGAAPASAAEVVAVGASQTFGKGVPRSAAYPAQLQGLLRERGIDVKVKNAGINGATTGKMLKNLSNAIGSDTRVVLFQPGSNDARKGKQDKTEKHIRKMLAKLEQRNIRCIIVSQSDYASYPRGPDGLHLTEEGYASLAKKLLPKVVAALR